MALARCLTVAGFFIESAKERVVQRSRYSLSN